MKFYLSIFIIFCFSLSLISAKTKCKFDLDKKDEITGNAIKEIILGTVSSDKDTAMKLTISKNGINYYLKTTFIIKANVYSGFNFNAVYPLEKDTDCIFKFENEKILTLKTMNKTVSTMKTDGFGGIYYHYEVSFDISAKENLQLFADNLLDIARIKIEDKDRTCILKDPKIKEKIKNAVLCIMEDEESSK